MKGCLPPNLSFQRTARPSRTSPHAASLRPRAARPLRRPIGSLQGGAEACRSGVARGAPLPALGANAAGRVANVVAAGVRLVSNGAR